MPRAESAFGRYMKKLSIAAFVFIEQNALRHSYGSYWLARGGKEGVGRLAINMGNSESTANSHYIEVLQPSEGEKWFSIRRDTPEDEAARREAQEAWIDEQRRREQARQQPDRLVPPAPPHWEEPQHDENEGLTSYD